MTEAKRREKKRYRIKHRDKWLASKKRWRERHRAERIAYQRSYYAANRERLMLDMRLSWPVTHAMRVQREMSDAAFYAHERRRARVSYAKAAVLAGRVYRPVYGARIPDWCVRGQTFDRPEPTLEQKAFAKQLHIERKEARNA
ncbi:MAG: hypothetical protein J6V72_02615 [Kiritimatiellae bacterium]|nr:hypothetical protein [Kiritimatiellia bacterium]